MSLQPADGDGLVLRAKNTSAFAQLLHRTYTRAGGAQQIGLQNGARGTSQVVGRNFLDELGYINVCGAGVRTRSVVAHQTSCRFDSGFVACQWRQKFAERIRTRRSLLNIRQRILLIANRTIRCTARDEERLEANATSFKRHSASKGYFNSETCFCINRKYNPPETTNPTNHA